jgi:hypothetical protein
MFCPSCGMEERQPSQYCRACGADLRAVRLSLQRPDDVTASAVVAREEIGRAFAARIREAPTTKDLAKITEDILPEIEKFLESPTERRLRRLRTGVVTAAVGLGVTTVLATGNIHLPFGPAAGILVFLVGIGTVINGLLFTVPQANVADRRREGEAQTLLDQLPPVPTSPIVQSSFNTGEIAPPSVTEGTTHQLPAEGVRPLHQRASS